MYSVFQVCWLLAFQVAKPPGSESSEPVAGAAPATGEAAAEPSFWGSMLSFLPLMLAVMVIYFLIMPKPNARQSNQSRELIENLKKNDRVITAGGILGTVVNVRSESDHVTIRIDDNTNTRMQILKQSITRVLDDESKSAS